MANHEPLPERQQQQLLYLQQTWRRRIQHAHTALLSSNGDKTRLGFFAYQMGDMVKEMSQLRNVFGGEATDAMLELAKELVSKLDDAVQNCGPTALSGWLCPAWEETTDRGGRPQICVDHDFLSHCVNILHLSTQQIGTLLFPDRTIPSSTVRKLIIRHGLRETHQPTHSFTNIDDANLSEYIHYIRALQPSVGVSYLRGGLLALGIFVPRARVQALASHDDQVAAVLRDRSTAVRRVYQNDGPNAVWHLDGQHELVNNGIVVHGIIDGDSRGVVGLRASTNNRADTVEDLFRDAMEFAGVPSKVRGDQGAENLKVAVLIMCVQGLRRGSFLWGTSPHNTRIERLWPEVVRLCLSQWYALFTCLESDHGYQCDIPEHVWLGTYLFLNDINHKLQYFQTQHNKHPVRTEGGRTPEQVFFMHSVQNGVRGLWEGDLLAEVTEAEAEVAEGWMQGEPRGHVDLEDQHCPFVDMDHGMFCMEEQMRGVWELKGEERWVQGLHALYTVLSEE